MSKQQDIVPFSKNDLFLNIAEAEISQFLNAGTTIAIKAGETLFEQGENADCLYLLNKGELIVRVLTSSQKSIEIDLLQPGAVVGEMALLTNSHRSATVSAQSDAELIRISKTQFFKHQARYPTLIQNMTKLFESRLQREFLAHILEQFFPNLDSDLILEIQEKFEWITVNGGEVLFQQGDIEESMYLVINGRLKITLLQPDNSSRLLTEITQGDIVGEFAMFSHEPRSATVTAIRDSDVARLSKADFEALVQQQPQAMIHITNLLVKRVQSANQNEALREHTAVETIAIIPLQADSEINASIDYLSNCLGKIGKTKQLDRTQFDAEFSVPNGSQIQPGDPFNPLVQCWLTEQENDNRFIVYVADPVWSNWTQRCLRQASRIIFVSKASANTAITQIEQSIQQANFFAPQELILLHPANTKWPEGTAAWLKPRQLKTHYHIQERNDAHYERASRRIAGTAICAVYSGGGARGFAHLGVWKALQELNIPLDFVGGTSMGSLMAALIGIGWDFEDIEVMADTLSNPKTLFDYTLPITSLMSSAKLTKFCKKVFGENRQIEDFWMPFFCIATNSSTAEMEIIQSGPVWKAIRKSISIPGVFTPVMENGNVIIDGGIMNNFPVDVMLELAESKRIIAVNVSPPKEKMRHYDLETSVSGWKILWSRINPFVRRLRTPSLIGIILRTLELNSVRLSKRQQLNAALLIEPDVSSVSLLDFASYQKAADIGYEASISKLKTWQESW